MVSTPTAMRDRLRPSRTGNPWRSLLPGRRADLAWALAAPAVVLVAACLPLLAARDFYFRDDTEIGAYPIWVRLGTLLRAGEWPLLEPSSWMAGNLAAEGQWGLFSPITLGISLLSTFSDSAVAFSTAVKLFFLCVAALGVHRLARSYGVRAPLAFAAGVAVPLNGFTLYMDAPSWVTGLITWSLLPWAWTSLRRTVLRGASPLPFLLLAYLIVTIGYFHGFLALGVVIIAVGADRLASRDWSAARAIVLAGVFCLLVAVAVYLPGVLTADVTVRDSEMVRNSGWLAGEVTGLLSSPSPTGMYRVSAWWGPWTNAPLMYTAWFLPVVALVPWSRLRGRLRDLTDLAVVGVVATLVVVGPSELGPLRFPVRVMPYVALALVVGVVVLLDRGLEGRPSGRALGVAAGWVLVASFLGWSQRPETLGAITLTSAAALLLGVTAVWWLCRSRARASWSLTAVAGVLAVGTVAATAAQSYLYPASSLPHFDMPGQLADYRTQLPDAVNDVVVVGRPSAPSEEEYETRFDAESRPPRSPDVGQRWQETLTGNSWLLSGASVQNTYSVIQHEQYAELMCMNHRGDTCPELTQRLFQAQPRVFQPLVDLLAVDTVHIVKRDVPLELRASPPDGWSVVHDSPATVTWIRDEPRGPAGGVVWSSDGTTVTELARSDRTVRLRVEAVPDDGGRVVLSRLAWPGYEVEGGSLREPLNGYLLDVDLAGAESGDVVTVSFSPPGWAAVQACLVLSVLLAVGWTAAHRWARPHTRRQRPSPAVPVGAASSRAELVLER